MQNCKGKTSSFDTTFWNRRNGIALVKQAGAGYSIGTNTGATNSGALTGSDFNMKAASGTSSSAVYMSKISSDASNGNSTVPDGASSGKIYGNSSHVTPRNIAVYMWKRTA